MEIGEERARGEGEENPTVRLKNIYYCPVAMFSNKCFHVQSMRDNQPR